MSNLISKLLKFYGPSLKGVELETLGLRLPRSAKHILYDDGFVNSIDARMKRLKRRYSDPAESKAESEAESKEDTSTAGMHYQAPVKVITKGNIGNWKVTLKTSATVNHIFYEMPEYKDEAFNEMVAIAVRAHEETHIAQTWGALGRLEKLIRKEQDKKIDLRGIDDDEVIAEVGAIYALRKNGYSMDDVERLSPISLPYFSEALALYQD